jgi:hypothetical protein
MSFHKERSRLVIYQSIWLHDKNDKMIKWKPKSTTLSEHFRNSINKIVKKQIPYTNTWPLTFRTLHRHFNKKWPVKLYLLVYLSKMLYPNRKSNYYHCVYSMTLKISNTCTLTGIANWHKKMYKSVVIRWNLCGNVQCKSLQHNLSLLS